jgi:hypothetical protein
VREIVLLDVVRPVALTEAAQVGRDHAKTAPRQFGDLVSPHSPRVGESVEQQHDRTGPDVSHVEGQLTDLDPAFAHAQFVGHHPRFVVSGWRSVRP